MAITSGARRAVSEGLVWFGLAFVGTVSIIYSNDLRALVGLDAASFRRSAEAAAPSQTARMRDQTGALTTTKAADSQSTVRLTADDRGHFTTQAHVNGRPIDVMVDTGATAVALTWNDARAAGIHMRESDFTQAVNTANGVAYVAPVTLDTISIGDILVRDVRAVVARPEQLHVTLLGMSFLKKLERVDMRGRELVLGQ
jgi:aspartyl protease family protein